MFKRKSSLYKRRYSSGDLHNTRLRLVTVSIAIGFIVLLLRIASLQIYFSSPAALKKIAEKQYNRSSKSVNYRGTLYDRKKVPLAISIKTPSLAVNPKVFNPTKKQRLQLAKLSSVSESKIKKISTLKRDFLLYIKSEFSNKILML